MLLALGIVWAVPRDVIRADGDQLLQLVGTNSTGGYWKIDTSYLGNVVRTDPKPLPFYLEDTVDWASQLTAIPQSSSTPLSSFTPQPSSSTSGSVSAQLELTMKTITSSGFTQAYEDTVSTQNAAIKLTLTWVPKYGDIHLDPAPRYVKLTYSRSVTAQGDSRDVNFPIDTWASCQSDLSAYAITNAYITRDDGPNIHIAKLSVTNGVASMSFPVQESVHLAYNGTAAGSAGGLAWVTVDACVPGFQLPRHPGSGGGSGPGGDMSGNNTAAAPDPSFTRWLPLSFSPQINTQPFRTQAGALRPPWGNVNCYYSMSFQQEPALPNYDVSGESALYVPKGYGGYQTLPGDFVPAFTITDADGERLIFDSGMNPYRDIHSTLTYNAGTGVYTLSNAGPPGALKAVGHYSYTFVAGRLTSISDDVGNSQNCVYSTSDPFLRVTDVTSGRSLAFHSLSGGGYISAVDALGPNNAINTHTVLTYDANGHMTSLKVYDAGGINLFNQAIYNYGGVNGDAITSKTEGVSVTSYAYTTDSNIPDPFNLSNDRLASSTFGSAADTSSSDSGGSVQGTFTNTWGPTQQGYNSWGIDAHTNTFTDARGSLFSTAFSLTYDTFGSINAKTNTGPDFTGAPAGKNVTRIFYNPDIVQPNSEVFCDQLYNAGLTLNPWQTLFDLKGNVTSTVDPLMHSWQYGYSVDGTLLTSVTDPTSLTWQFRYGENGAPASRLTSVVDPGGATISKVTYNGFGQPITSTTPAAISPIGADETVNYTYHPTTGDLLGVTDPLGNQYQIGGYDGLGDPQSGFLFPDTGNPATSLTPLGGSIQLNSAQQPVLSTAGNGLQVKGTYNNGVLTQAQTLAPAAAGGAVLNQTNWSYDSRSRMYGVSDALGTLAQYRFDGNSNTTQLQDGAGNATRFTYGSNNELKSVIWPGGSSSSVLYDIAGRVQTATDERGIVSTYLYYADNNVSDIQFPATPAQNVHFTYDPVGRLTSVTDGTGSRTNSYDTLGRLHGVTTVITALPIGHNTFAVSYGYFGDGSLASVTSPLGTTYYAYNTAGQVTSQTDALGHTTSWSYDHAGRETARTTTSPNGTNFVTAYTYGGSNLPGDTSTAPYYLNRITQTISGRTAWTYNLQHSYTGQLTAVQGVGGQTGQSVSAQFGYDPRGRLTSEQQTYQADAQHTYTKGGSYQYDAAGNLQGGAGGWTFNSNNQVTSAPASGGLPGATGLSYNASGNLTGLNGETFSYDSLGHFTQALNTPQGNVGFAFNAEGNCVSQTVGGQSSYFLYDGGALLATLDANGNLTAGFSWGQDGLIADSSAGSGERFYSFDPSGSTSGIWSAVGQALWQGAYSAWGQSLTGQASGTFFGYQGQGGSYTDPATGMVDVVYGYEIYVPSLGRMAGPDSSYSPNPYSIPGNDPVNTGNGGAALLGDSLPTQQNLYAPFLREVNALAERGKQALQIAASTNPLYNIGEGYTGQDLYNHKVPAWQRALDIAGIVTDGAGDLSKVVMSGSKAAEKIPAVSSLKRAFELIHSGQNARVATREEAEAVALFHSLEGYRNTSGVKGEDVKKFLEDYGYKGAYRWDEEVKSEGGIMRLANHSASNVDGLYRHLQIETLTRIKQRVFFGPPIR